VLIGFLFSGFWQTTAARKPKSTPNSLPANSVVTPASTQRSHNILSRDAWGLFDNHRSHTTGLALAFASPEKLASLVVLGAGNCNDLALVNLSRAFASVHLCDIDEHALAHGVETQLGRADGRMIPHVMDITGIFPLLGKLGKAKQKHPSTNFTLQLAALSEALAKFEPRKLSPDFEAGFDVLLSTSVLSQIIVTAESYIPDSILGSMQIQVRDAHVRTMVDLLKRGGTGILVSDFVSTETFAQLWSMTDEELTHAVLIQLLTQKNFFNGCHPMNIMMKLKSVDFAPLVTNVSLVSVWKWALSPQRQYAVAAISFQRR
jgi:hypothetical protein